MDGFRGDFWSWQREWQGAKRCYFCSYCKSIPLQRGPFLARSVHDGDGFFPAHRRSVRSITQDRTVNAGDCRAVASQVSVSMQCRIRNDEQALWMIYRIFLTVAGESGTLLYKPETATVSWRATPFQDAIDCLWLFETPGWPAARCTLRSKL